jgi:hypothetical protein
VRRFFLSDRFDESSGVELAGASATIASAILLKSLSGTRSMRSARQTAVMVARL